MFVLLGTLPTPRTPQRLNVQCNPTYRPFPSPGQVPTGGGHGQRRGRATCDATTEIPRLLAQKGSFSSCVVLRALAAVAGRTTTAVLLLLLLRFFVAFSLSICYGICARAHAMRRDVTRWAWTTATSTSAVVIASAIYRNRNLLFRFRPTALATTVAVTTVDITAPRLTSLRVAHVDVVSRVALRRHVPPVGRRRHDHDHDQRSAVGGRRSGTGGRRSTAAAAAAAALGMDGGAVVASACGL